MYDLNRALVIVKRVKYEKRYLSHLNLLAGINDSTTLAKI